MTLSHCTPIQRAVDLALEYASRGWPVLPCHTVLPNACGCTCGNEHCLAPAKHPVASGGSLTATIDLDCVRRWWEFWPRANVAIRTGFISRLVVLNVDINCDGLATLHDRLRGGSLPETLTVETGSGGLHLYFQQPCRALRIDRTAIDGPGLSVCTDDDYVIAPPSMHETGSAYTWSNTAPIMPAPRWLCRTREREVVETLHLSRTLAIH